MTVQINTISFFSGGGLKDFGARDAGTQIVYANEIDPRLASYHAANFKHPDGTPVVQVKPIQEVTVEEILDTIESKYGNRNVHAVCGGPPCVDFSLLNSRKKNGFDSKNWLVMSFLEKVRLLNPMVAVMEEVPAFLNHPLFYPMFLEAVGKMNYEVKGKVMCALNYEGNSIRRRAIFIFIRKDLGKMPVFPKPIATSSKKCGDFLDIDYFTSGHFDDRMRSSNEPMTTVTSGSPHLFFKTGISRKPTEREIMLCQSLDPDRYVLPPNHSYSIFRKVMGNGVPSMMAFHLFKTLVDEVLIPAIQAEEVLQ